MVNAVWLLLAVPMWYAICLAAPLSAGWLTLIPAAGTLSLAGGAVIAKIRSERRALLFFIPFVLTEVAVAAAGAMRGQLRGGESTATTLANTGLIAFVVIEIGIAGYLIYLLKGARSSALALAFFSVTYAVFGAFVATMSFSDSWL